VEVEVEVAVVVEVVEEEADLLVRRRDHVTMILVPAVNRAVLELVAVLLGDGIRVQVW